MALLEVNHLSISFGGLRAVDDLSFSIEKGELYGLIGPNGAGKTTVFNLLTGVYSPTEGIIKLGDTDITGKKTIDINKEGIARTFQNIRLFGKMSVIDNVKVALNNSSEFYYGSLHGILHTPKYHRIEKALEKRALELLEVFDLDKERDVLASNLPYGKQRKLEIARAMATEPKLLLLDEPAAGMNPNETAELMNTISLIRSKFGMTILLIEHDMKLVSGICERLTVLNFGKVLKQGETKTVLNDPEVIKAYIGE
ncbi:ABC transporter ATP-binding protein [Butyrivibrio sp. NC3005]|uniref:ABC transporter ATP-binding protein n=1 Tax=Butyrivibrio sp. NC3005 TaxID=1280685 RepID=UPI0003F5E008|nr:ABC transporter ATP-binding protein [Butyrivibrio sp. NC3005]